MLLNNCSTADIKTLQSKSPVGEFSIPLKSSVSDLSVPFESRKFIRAKDAAEYLSVSKSHFHSLIRKGILPEGKLISGAVRVWRVIDLDQAADKMWEVA